jgi:DNA-binding NarL/FixJ family response regulator
MMPGVGIPLVLFIGGNESSMAAEALQRGSRLGCALAIAETFEEAEQGITRGIVPDVIFLRLSGEQEDGRSTHPIGRLRAHGRIQHIPIVVFGGSSDPVFIARVYEYPMTCYIQRPSSDDEYVSVLRNAFDFWCTTAVLPANHENWRSQITRAGITPGPKS